MDVLIFTRKTLGINQFAHNVPLKCIEKIIMQQITMYYILILFPRNNGCFSIITADGLTVCLGFGENVILRENKGGNIWPANTITFGAAKEKPEVPGRPETRASAQPA